MEVMIAFLLLAIVGGIAMVSLSSILISHRGFDQRHEAAVALETVGELFQLRTKQQWPNDVSVQNANFGSYLYSVDDFGLEPNPLSARPLPIKRLQVTLEYQAKNATGEQEPKVIKANILVGL